MDKETYLQPVLDASKYCDLKILESGRERCIPNKQFEYAIKQYHLFHYVISGKGTFEFKGRKYELTKGALFYIPPKCSAHYYPNKTNPWQYSWIGFDGQMASFFLASCGITNKNPVYYDTDDSLRPNFDNLWNRYQMIGKADTMCLGYLYQILTQMVSSRDSSAKQLSSGASYATSAKEFINNNYQFDIKIGDIANNVGVNPNYLSNVFKENMGVSPKQYLTKVRMDRACSILQMGKAKIKEVAEAVGYSNQLHFSSEFRKKYGISPIDYMNNQNNNS